MCGIVATLTDGDVDPAVDAMAHRGPDARGVADLDGVLMGHRRLAIIDLDPRSDQPFRRAPLTLVYNGELWNWRNVRAQLEAEGEAFTTEGDTEVVAAALERWGEAALDRFEGMFALAWALDGESGFHAARDRFGEVPLHWTPWAVASERRALLALGQAPALVQDFGPGEVAWFRRGALPDWRRWYFPPIGQTGDAREEAADKVRELLGAGVVDRTVADVPVCATISGGLDSAAIVAHLSVQYPGLTCYTAVMDPRSPDLRHARIVADHFGCELVEVPVAEPTADDLAACVGAVELPYKAQVEIAWPCLALAAKMRADGFKVTYGGEGSDELWASYGFAYHGVKKAGWGAYRRSLFLGQASRNFMRANKAFMRHGVEVRLPFLSTALVEYALSLRQDVVQDASTPKGSKMVLREAYRGWVPDQVVDRAKLAFQDGLGMKTAAGRAVGDPRRFYAAEYARRYA